MSVAQVIVRGSEGTSFHVSQLCDKPPTILIGTPQAILDILQEAEYAINLSRLRSVVVDEVDYMIDFIPANASKYQKQKLEAKMKRHPTAGKLLLDRIYGPRVQPDGIVAVRDSPQLIACSATLPTGLRQRLYQSGWFKKGTGMVVKVRSEMPVGNIREPETNAAGIGPEAQMVEHCALVFSEDGSVRDVVGSVESKHSSEVRKRISERGKRG
jgi:superfamily II DNA/RNA helicase